MDADVDEKQVMKLVRNQKGVVQDCAVVLFGLCEACAGNRLSKNKLLPSKAKKGIL